MSKQIPISQSLIKKLKAYGEGKECGEVVKAQYIDDVRFPSSEVQLLGQYFEFMCSGQVPKYGGIPNPPTLKNGSPIKKFSDILKHIPYFKKMLEAYGLEIVSTGKKIKGTYNGIDISGEVDLECRYVSDVAGGVVGDIVYVDIKTSGLIHDKWSEFGWHEDGIEYKDNTLLQALHYKYIGKQELGYTPDFIFMVFSNTNTIDRLAYKITLDEDVRFMELEQMITKSHAIMSRPELLKAKPEANRCLKCHLKEIGKCDQFEEVPKVKEIYY